MALQTMQNIDLNLLHWSLGDNLYTKVSIPLYIGRFYLHNTDNNSDATEKPMSKQNLS